jgi:hypothetical protein
MRSTLTQKPKKGVHNGINGSYEIFLNYQRMNAEKEYLFRETWFFY